MCNKRLVHTSLFFQRTASGIGHKNLLDHNYFLLSRILRFITTTFLVFWQEVFYYSWAGVLNLLPHRITKDISFLLVTELWASRTPLKRLTSYWDPYYLRSRGWEPVSKKIIKCLELISLREGQFYKSHREFIFCNFGYNWYGSDFSFSWA